MNATEIVDNRLILQTQFQIQTQSRLCTLPPEIRAHIFTLALTADDDASKPYRADRKYYRPGYESHRKLHTALISTCKQVYHEARLLHIWANEHLFWLFDGPWKAIGRSRNTARWDNWYFNFDEDQKRAVRKVHIFIQQYYLEHLITTDARRFPVRTRCLHLTFRHSDWWSWESPPASSDRLGICPWRRGRTSCQEMLAEPAQPDLDFIKAHMVDGTWGATIAQIMSLRTLVLEFETDEKKKSQLQVVVERAKAWQFPMAWENFVLEWNGQLEESSWEGIKDLKNDDQYLRERPVADDAPKRKYYVVKMVWKAQRI